MREEFGFSVHYLSTPVRHCPHPDRSLRANGLGRTKRGRDVIDSPMSILNQIFWMVRAMEDDTEYLNN